MHSIKFAKPEDVTQIVSLGYKSFDENSLAGIGASPDFDKALLTLTESVVEDVVLVKRNEQDQRLIDGVLVLKHSETWWSNQTLLFSLLFFVKEEFRTTRTAVNLLKAAKEYAIINGLPIVFDIFAQKDVQKKKKLLKILGFKECGTLFIFNPLVGE